MAHGNCTDDCEDVKTLQQPQQPGRGMTWYHVLLQIRVSIPEV
jgi:hypothetical protein